MMEGGTMTEGAAIGRQHRLASPRHYQLDRTAHVLCNVADCDIVTDLLADYREATRLLKRFYRMEHTARSDYLMTSIALNDDVAAFLGKPVDTEEN